MKSVHLKEWEGEEKERERERGRIYASHTEKQSWIHKIIQDYSPFVGDYGKDDSGKEHQKRECGQSIRSCSS